MDTGASVVQAARLRDVVVANIVEKALREQLPIVWVQHSDQHLRNTHRLMSELTRTRFARIRLTSSVSA